MYQEYLRVQSGVWLVRLKQIMQALVVDLHVAHAQPAVLPIVWGSQLGCLGKQILQCARDQTSTGIVCICMTSMTNNHVAPQHVIH